MVRHMRRVATAIALTIGIVAGVFAQPAAAAYNTAPAQHICAYWAPNWALMEWRDVDFGGTGLYYAHVYCRWRYFGTNHQFEAEGLYRRRDGYHVIYSVRCISPECG